VRSMGTLPLLRCAVSHRPDTLLRLMVASSQMVHRKRVREEGKSGGAASGGAGTGGTYRT